MTTLYEELHPLATAVDEARTKVVDAARAWCHAGNAGAEEELKTTVKALDEAQMALGLKTAQLLLASPQALQPTYMLNPEAPALLPGPPPRPTTVGNAWTKKRSE